MGDCCSSSGCDVKHPKKRRCPVSGSECPEVSVRTILHHIKAAWQWTPSAEHYYFCGDADCDVVYFGDDGSLVSRSGLRTRVGQKEQAGDGLLCYCFGVSRADVARQPSIRDFVVEQTRARRCACETRNPAGRCCLKDFPEPKD